jgi:hypothetical protein
MMSDDPARWNTVERQTWSARQNRAALTAELLRRIEGAPAPVPAQDPQFASA